MTLKTKNILKVADAIEKGSVPKLGFNMAWWISNNSVAHPDMSGRNCGTTACVAGWSHCVRTGQRKFNFSLSDFNADDEAEWLGLNARQQQDLFGFEAGNPNRSPTNLQAAACLRRLAETGEVDWQIATCQIRNINL